MLSVTTIEDFLPSIIKSCHFVKFNNLTKTYLITTKDRKNEIKMVLYILVEINRILSFLVINQKFLLRIHSISFISVVLFSLEILRTTSNLYIRAHLLLIHIDMYWWNETS